MARKRDAQVIREGISEMTTSDDVQSSGFGSNEKRGGLTLALGLLAPGYCEGGNGARCRVSVGDTILIRARGY